MTKKPLLPFFVRQHILVFEGISFFVASVLIVTLGTFSFASRALELRSEITIKQNKLVDIENQVFFLSSLDEEILKRRMTLLNSVLPANKDILLYLATIEGLSRELSLTLRGIELAPGEILSSSGTQTKSSARKPSSSGTYSLDTELVITGSEDKLYAFLRAIEEAAPLMTVKDVKVSRLADKSFSLSVVLAMIYADNIDPQTLKGKNVLFSDSEEKALQQIAKFRTYAGLANLDSTEQPVGKVDLFENLINSN